MNLLHAAILGLVEGVTEFLPISSTAHLTLVSYLLGLPQSDFVKTFEISIQSGAIFAALIYYRKRFLSSHALVGFIPTAVIGLIFYPLIKHYLIGNLGITLIAILIGGLVLLFIKPKSQLSSSLTYPQAFLIGLFQATAVIPGVSRSAAAIVGGLLVGQSQVAATEFSFLLAIPTLFAATALDLYKSASWLTLQNIPVLFAGFLVSFISALVAIKLFIGYVSNHSLRSFGIYRIILALLILLSLVKSA